MTILLALACALLAVIAAWIGWAVWASRHRGLSFHQTFLHAPMKVLWRIEDHSALNMASAPPVIYAVLHQSRIDPALMLSLLPSDTLHILDETSSRAAWLEPWREMARTIAFNPGHVFVSRRLVRQLRGRGRLAVYFADGLERDAKAFRLYRAVARIAQAAQAQVVPVSVQGSRFLRGVDGERRLLPKLRIIALAPMTIADMVERGGEGTTRAAALHGRVMEADAADRHGAQSPVARASAASRRA